MKKLFYFLLTVFVLLASLLLWYDQSRKYYCLPDDKCVTAWKRLGGDCYIISGKYSSWFKPSDDYVKTSNTQNLTLYYSDKLSNNIIIRNQGTSEGLEGGYEIIGNTFSKYKNELQRLLYPKDATYRNDVNVGVVYIDIHIKENYARDNFGNKL